MKANRRKYIFRVTGHGRKATVTARTRGAAVHQFRRAVQPEACHQIDGCPAKVRQVQPRTLLDDGSWDDVQIECKGAA